MNPERDDNGNLPAYAWPGGYPIYYLCTDGGVVCPTCANKEVEVRQADEHADYPDSDQWRIVASDINWENSTLICDNCNGCIESAYTDEKGGAE